MSLRIWFAKFALDELECQAQNRKTEIPTCSGKPFCNSTANLNSKGNINVEWDV